MPGASSAAPDEGGAEADNDSLVVNVVGFEIDGPLSDCTVEYENEQKSTDEEGNVAFEINGDSAELTLEKEGWDDRTKTVNRDEADGEIYVPLYVTNTIDP